MFLLPLRMPCLRFVRPLRSASLNCTSGSSPPFSMPAPKTSTPFRRASFPPLPLAAEASDPGPYASS